MLKISSGDGVVGYGADDLYWGWCGVALCIFTGDGMVGYVAVGLYWGPCGRIWRCKSLLETLR